MVDKNNADIQNAVLTGGQLSLPMLALVPLLMHKQHKQPRYFYISRVRPSAVEAALARPMGTGGKSVNCVRGRVFWVRGKPATGSCILDKCVERDSICYPHVSDTLVGSFKHQGTKLSDNVCNESKDVTDVSHGVERDPMCHNSDNTALFNSVTVTNEQSGQQDTGQCVSDSDYPGLNPGPSVCGHMGLSQSLHTEKDFSGSLLQIHNIVKKSGKPNFFYKLVFPSSPN